MPEEKMEDWYERGIRIFNGVNRRLTGRLTLEISDEFHDVMVNFFQNTIPRILRGEIKEPDRYLGQMFANRINQRWRDKKRERRIEWPHNWEPTDEASRRGSHLNGPCLGDLDDLIDRLPDRDALTLLFFTRNGLVAGNHHDHLWASTVLGVSRNALKQSFLRIRQIARNPSQFPRVTERELDKVSKSWIECRIFERVAIEQKYAPIKIRKCFHKESTLEELLGRTSLHQPVVQAYVNGMKDYQALSQNIENGLYCNLIEPLSAHFVKNLHSLSDSCASILRCLNTPYFLVHSLFECGTFLSMFGEKTLAYNYLVESERHLRNVKEYDSSDLADVNKTMGNIQEELSTLRPTILGNDTPMCM